MWRKINNLIGFRLFIDTTSTPSIFLILQAKFISWRGKELFRSRDLGLTKYFFTHYQDLWKIFSYLVLSPQLMCTSVLLFVQMIVTLSLEWLGVALFLFFLNNCTFTSLYTLIFELGGVSVLASCSVCNFVAFVW